MNIIRLKMIKIYLKKNQKKILLKFILWEHITMTENQIRIGNHS